MEVTEPYDFFLAPLDEADDGSLSVSSDGYVNLEDAFPGLRYEKLEGVEKRGQTRNYEETWAESDEAAVYVPDDAPRAQNEATLTLYFFGTEPTITSVEENFQSFADFVEGKKFIYRDTARKRKMLLYQSGDISPKTMVLNGGIPYFECAFTFKTVFGHASIPASETYADVSGDTAFD